MNDRVRPDRRRADADDIESNAWIYRALQDVREELLAGHVRLRDDMANGFRELGRKLDDHAVVDAAVERRVSEIEWSAKTKKDAAQKRSTYISLGISAAMVGFWKLVDFWMKKP